MDGVEIRAATADDAHAVAGYHGRCFARTFAAAVAAGELEAPDRADTRDQLQGRFTPGSGFETRVAVIDGAPIGHVTVTGAHLVHLFVDPARQGAGLGRRLLGVGEALMVADGHHDLELHARVDNHAAIAFYERMGWEVTGRVIHTVEHGIAYDEHVLTKHVRRPDQSMA